MVSVRRTVAAVEAVEGVGMAVATPGVDVIPCNVVGSGCSAGIVVILSGGLSDELYVVVVGPAVPVPGPSGTWGPAGSRVRVSLCPRSAQTSSGMSDKAWK